jgi:hypothetical protein
MNSFGSSDPSSLSGADERSLELWRYELVVNCDDRREPVIDELLRRGTAVVTRETVRLGRAAGLAREHILAASEEATITLAMRLRRTTRLTPITALARELADEAVRARAPEAGSPPRLVSRPPELRPIIEKLADEAGRTQTPPSGASLDTQLADALRRGRIKRNNPETS